MGPDDLPGGASGASRGLRRAGLTLYGTLLLVGLAAPHSLVAALREARPHLVAEAVLAAAEPAAGLIEATGVPGLFRAARERFRLLSCGAPDSENPC